MISTTLIRRGWKRAILAMKPAPFRFVRQAAKPSLKAKMKARGIVSGIDWLLSGFVNAVRGATIFPVKGATC